MPKQSKRQKCKLISDSRASLYLLENSFCILRHYDSPLIKATGVIEGIDSLSLKLFNDISKTIINRK